MHIHQVERHEKGILARSLPRETPPLPGEMLASWVARIAVMNGFDPHALATWANSNRTRPGWILTAPESMISQLCKASGIEAERLRELTFLHEMDLVSYPFAQKRDQGNWLIPIPDDVYAQPSLSQFCVECLISDQVPYLRKVWRFAFLTHCTVHRSTLLSCCPSCGMVLNPFAEEGLDPVRFHIGLFVRCLHCGSHFGHQPILWALSEPPSVQRAIHLSNQVQAAIRDGWTWIGGLQPLRASLFLSGLRIILRILGTRFGLEFRLWLEHQSGLEWTPAEGERPTYFARFEVLPHTERVRLLAGLDWLLEDWPERWLEGCAAAGLRGTFVLEQKARQFPFWLASACIDPLIRLNHPGSQASILTASFAGRRFGRSFLGLQPNSFDRLDFLVDHPEWEQEIPQLALAMRDFGLYQPDADLNHIEGSCAKYLRLIKSHNRTSRERRKPLALSGYIQKRAWNRRFLRALKAYLRMSLHLEEYSFESKLKLQAGNASRAVL